MSLEDDTTIDTAAMEDLKISVRRWNRRKLQGVFRIVSDEMNRRLADVTESLAKMLEKVQEIRGDTVCIPPEANPAYLQENLKATFKRGIEEGIRAYAWWKDGVQYVGNCGHTLAEALREASKILDEREYQEGRDASRG